MNLTLFGASGRTGQLLLRMAIDYGYHVTAFTRSPDKIKFTHTRLTVFQGDVLNYTDVLMATSHADVVLCTLGIDVNTRSTTLSDATMNIIEAMKENKCKRLIIQSSLGVAESSRYIGGFFRWFILPVFLRYIFIDKALQEQYVKESGLEWIIVRPAGLTSKREKRNYHVSINKKIPRLFPKISRADVSRFMLQQIVSDEYLHQKPCLWQ